MHAVANMLTFDAVGTEGCFPQVAQTGRDSALGNIVPEPFRDGRAKVTNGSPLSVRHHFLDGLELAVQSGNVLRGDGPAAEALLLTVEQ